MGQRLARVLDPEFVVDIQSLSTQELRARRDECAEVETALSYVRRLAQGHLDILVADLRRRAVGDSSPQVSDMVDQLNEILSSGPAPAPSAGRLPSMMTPDLDEEVVAELESALADLAPGDLSALSDEEAIAVGERLRDFERRISRDRRALHEHMALFEADVVRRYKAGETNVDTLLQQ
ncbi:MAG: AmfC protein [Actinobacteria bacterium]|nr:AmfC protein [Actinomycetota bacterium]